jgi:hypothetical protein
MPERAEIEAVARTSWVCDVCGWSHTFDEPMTTVYCVACWEEGRGADVRCRLTFPLDRVRDARDDERWAVEAREWENAASKALAALEEAKDDAHSWEERYHESEAHVERTEAEIARLSYPSRDGTVEVEALREAARKLISVYMADGDLDAAMNELEAAAGFSQQGAGESNEGGNQ